MRMRTICLCCLLLLPLTAATGADCLESTAALESMEQRSVRFLGGGSEALELIVRVAETSRQRAAGMQHLCEPSVRDNPMLFRFQQPVQHAFHMQNVQVPLDIFFLDESGMILSRQRMVPGEGLYRPDHSFRYALELLAGEAERLGLEEGMQLRPRSAD